MYAIRIKNVWVESKTSLEQGKNLIVLELINCSKILLNRISCSLKAAIFHASLSNQFVVVQIAETNAWCKND